MLENFTSKSSTSGNRRNPAGANYSQKDDVGSHENSYDQAEQGNKVAAVGSGGSSSASGNTSGDYGVSRWNMGSSGFMDSNKTPVMTESNRGAFGNSAKNVDRGPNSQYGVARKMPWDS